MLYNLLRRSGLGLSDYWIWDTNAWTQESATIATDANNNIFIEADPVDPSMKQLSPLGIPIWEKMYNEVNSSQSKGVCADTNGDALFVGTIHVTAEADQGGLTKMNGDGTNEWRYRIRTGTPATLGNFYYKCVADGTDFYVSGATTDTTYSGASDGILHKISTTGAITWQKIIGGSGSDNAWGVAVDTANNVYTCIATSPASEIHKYNSSGTQQWKRKLTSGSGDVVTYDITTDSSDNVYVVGLINASDQIAIIAKYNSSGTIQWQKEVTSATDDVDFRGVYVDGSDGIYIQGRIKYSASADVILYKFDGTGAVTWSRKFNHDPSTFMVTELHQMHIDSNDDVLFSCEGTGNRQIVAKLPNDGTLTGTYGDYTYATISLTVSAGGMTDAVGTLSNGNSTFTRTSTPGTLSSDVSAFDRTAVE